MDKNPQLYAPLPTQEDPQVFANQLNQAFIAQPVPQPQYAFTAQPIPQPQYAFVAQPIPQPQYSATIYVGDPYQDATPFVPNPNSFGTQLAKVPHFMWRAISGPSMKNFNELKLDATWGMVWFLLLVEIVILLALKLMATAIEIRNAYYYEGYGFVVGVSIAGTLLSFFVVNGFFAMFARCLAGHRPELQSHPTFLQYCYCSLLTGIPLGILTAFLGMIPVAGTWLVFVAFIYELVLWVCAMKGVWHMTTCQAVGVIILFVVCIFVLALVLAFTVGMALVTAIMMGA